MESSDFLSTKHWSIEEIANTFHDEDFAHSFCKKTFSEILKWTVDALKRRKDFDPQAFDEVLYSPIRKKGIPYSLGYFDRRIHFSSNDYRPTKPRPFQKGKDDIVYYFAKGKLCFVMSGNLYQVEGDEAFSFNEKGRFVCGSIFMETKNWDRSVFLEDGGTQQYVFYTNTAVKTSVLLSMNAYSFVVFEYGKRFGSWKEKNVIQKGLFPLETALSILKSFHPSWTDKLGETIARGYQLLQAYGWTVSD